MSSPTKVYVVGIGDDGLESLTGAARQLVDQAEVLLGAERLLASVTNPMAKRIDVGSDFDELLAKIEEHADKRSVLLATGDPLFYGTARYLCEHLGKERFEVVPHVSSMQLAFARVKESWDEAYLTNLANQSLERVVERIRTAEKVGIFTTEEAPPSAVAKAMLDRQIDYFHAYVCENLGSPDERVTQCDLTELAEQTFAPLNVLVLVRNPDVPDRPSGMIGRRLFGNPDEAFLQSKPKRGLLTPSEVRVMALAEMDIGPASVVWDIGAGSGSVAVEAAQIASGGSVFAIEKDAEDYQLISENAERFGVTNLTAILGQAPEAWAELPDPDSVFIGGTGRAVTSIAREAFARLRKGGRLVVNVGSIENVGAVHEALRQSAGDANVWMFNIARGTQQLVRLRFESLNPTFLISTVKD
ncbi:MAG: precorrin-6y C5,15-methyltransferase (decarboxylating) subunit CbiE [Planctomycetales bacterium]|nr:precorrin-6y C5,15-methyltransferase (decarboxylating) subunit CbiE [Planctomycetales bacterium]